MKKLRRSMLFCPANNGHMLKTVHLKNPDCIIFDLEDAISYSEKEYARNMLCEAIRTMDYGHCEVWARINPINTPFGEDDVKELVKSGLKNIRLPMCESKANIKELDDILSYYESLYGCKEGEVKIQGAIETPKGVLNALEIASASKRVISISFGAEDYTNCLGINRQKTSMEFLYARSHIAICASVANVDSVDTIFSDYKDLTGFENETTDAKNLGFTGKSCIHPSQIIKVHEIFTPTKEETSEALKIIEAAAKAEKGGIGVITVDGKMIDKPIIEKSKKIIKLAKGAGMIQNSLQDVSSWEKLSTQ